MGFELVVGKLEDWQPYKNAAKEAASRLMGADVCHRCGGSGTDPEHAGVCGECGAIVKAGT
jgi:ribosomal protein L40E